MTPREKILAALEISKRATPGPWTNAVSIGVIYDCTGMPILTGGDFCDKEYRANAAHISQMTPEFTQAVLEGWLEMMDELESTAENIECGTGRARAKHALASARKRLEGV
jgi:hypothetical protein